MNGNVKGTDLPEMGQPWRDHAACKGHPRPEWWYDGRGRAYEAALKICADCPVRLDCLHTALMVQADHDFGIWGGMGAAERNKIRWSHRRNCRPMEGATT